VKPQVRYEAAGATQITLRELVMRGERATAAARAILAQPAATPWITHALGMSTTTGREHSFPAGSVTLRAVPYTRHRFDDWAVSKAGHTALIDAATALGNDHKTASPATSPHQSGLRVEIRSHSFDVALEGHPVVVVKAATDRAGVLGFQLLWGHTNPSPDLVPVALDEFRNRFLRPLLDAAVQVLTAAETYGRTELQLDLCGLSQLIRLIDQSDSLQPVPNLPLGGELSIPGATDPGPAEASALAVLADTWRDDVARACGLLLLR
jgi:hypothetical protein